MEADRRRNRTADAASRSASTVAPVKESVGTVAAGGVVLGEAVTCIKSGVPLGLQVSTSVPPCARRERRLIVDVSLDVSSKSQLNSLAMLPVPAVLPVNAQAVEVVVAPD
jgi:hypothetical protein